MLIFLSQTITILYSSLVNFIRIFLYALEYFVISVEGKNLYDILFVAKIKFTYICKIVKHVGKLVNKCNVCEVCMYATWTKIHNKTILK